MIELIFLIVVIGILATVAIPRYFSVKNESDTMMAKTFAGTMTRTVGHTMWSRSLADGYNGSLKYGGDQTKFGGKPLDFYVDIPVQFDASSVNFNACIDGNGTANPFLTHATGYEYNLFCRDGNVTTAPKFVADKNATYTF